MTGPLREIDDPASFDHRFVDLGDVRLHYVEQGQGPLILLLHGFPFIWYLWRHQIRELARAGYRVVAPDQRGYGRSDRPEGIAAYDMTRLAGDVIRLVHALGETSAVLVGQDWGSPIAWHAAAMRPDVVSAVVMIGTPPAARGPLRPSSVLKAALGGKNYYQDYFAGESAAREITADLRRFLLGVFYSTSGACSEAEQWRWAWSADETFFDTVTVPDVLPPYLSERALDYYTAQFQHSGIQPALNWYRAIDTGWENTSFLDRAAVHQPALYIKGARDPSLKTMFGIDRQGPALAALARNVTDLKGIIDIPGVGHTPPEEAPETVTAAILAFLKGL